jgi:hypothetical protein
MKLDKITFNYLQSIKNKKIVLFGSGNIAEKTIRKCNDLKIDFIVDNSKNLQNSKFLNFDVLSPDTITDEHVVLICSTAISDISDQLNKIGLIPNKNYFISPILNDLLAIEELEKIKGTFYFTSGTVAKKEFGGGLYKVEINSEDYKLTKIYSGPCYGLILKGSNLYFIDTDKGILECNTDDESVTFIKSTPGKSRAHGISFNESNNRFYLTCSYLDAVIEYDQYFNELRQFKLSNKIDFSGSPAHHCNDNFSIDNSLFVSMFSSTGNWKKDVFDGCIAEFNIETGERLEDITKNLYMPHNVKFYDGSIHVLDSLPGHLRTNNFSIIGTFPAFTRGLDYKNGLYFIGQSKNRNFSKVLGLSNNISIDCGIIIFNPTQKVSRFIPISMKIGEIHSIIAFQ